MLYVCKSKFRFRQSNFGSPNPNLVLHNIHLDGDNPNIEFENPNLDSRHLNLDFHNQKIRF